MVIVAAVGDAALLTQTPWYTPPTTKASMIRFADLYPDSGILQPLTAKLGWTHFVSLLRLEDPLQRDFYTEMCRMEGWSTRTLEEKIASRLYDRTALSRKPAILIQNSTLPSPTPASISNAGKPSSLRLL